MKQLLVDRNFNCTTEFDFVNTCYSSKTESCVHINGFLLKSDAIISVSIKLIIKLYNKFRALTCQMILN